MSEKQHDMANLDWCIAGPIELVLGRTDPPCSRPECEELATTLYVYRVSGEPSMATAVLCIRHVAELEQAVRPRFEPELTREHLRQFQEDWKNWSEREDVEPPRADRARKIGAYLNEGVENLWMTGGIAFVAWLLWRRR